MSTRFTDLPISFQSLGSFSFTSLGGSSLAAASATLPKLIRRGPGPCTMKLLFAAHSDAGTPHSCAAAAQVFLRIAYGPAADRGHVAPGALAPDVRVGGGVLDLHAPPVATQLL